MAKKKKSSRTNQTKKSDRERRLQLDEAASARKNALVHAVVAVVTFPPYLIDKLRLPIGISLVGICCLYLPLTAAAGEKTEVVLNVLMDLAINDWVYWLAISLLTGGNVIQGVARRRYIKRHGQREKELEARLDPNRTTSGLSPTGDASKG